MAILPDIPVTNLMASYGGPKINYAPVEDATTDEDAANRNDYVEDISGMGVVSTRAFVRFVGTSTTGAAAFAATGFRGEVWGNATAPVITRTGTGVYTIVWPTTITDSIAKVHTLALRGADVPNFESSTLYSGQVVMTSANSVTVYVFNAAGTASDAVGVTISVKVW